MSPIAQDVVSRLRREAEFSVARARNGARYLAGTTPPRVDQTPKDVVWARDKVQLWRYRATAPRRGLPVLIFLGAVSRSYVLDLLPENSYVRRLIDDGHDVFLLDWGVPDAAEARNTFETYVNFYLPRAIEATLAEAASDELFILPYCFGAVYAMLLLASQPDLPVRGMVTMAAPLDFTHLSVLVGPLRDGTLTPEAVVDDDGMVPPAAIRRFFQARKPTYDVAQYADIWQKLMDDRQLEGHRALTQWARDHVPFPGALLRQVTAMLLRENGFMTDRIRVGGRRVHLADIDVPVLNVVAQGDDIVPRAASAPMAELLERAEVAEAPVPGGHVGLVIGGAAVRTTMPAISGWLHAHADDRGLRTA